MSDREDPVLGDELVEFGRALRAVLARSLDPQTVTRLERDEEYPRDLLRSLAAWGLHGALLPEDVGGGGGGPLAMAVACEELGRWGGSIAASFMSTVTACAKLLAAGLGEPLRSTVLTEVMAGDRHLAFALSEPGAGSDVGSVRTRARPGPGGFTIDGEKTWCTGADTADDLVVVCRTREGTSTAGLTALLVPTTSPGLRCDPIPKLGHNAIHTCTVSFDGVVVGAERVIGEVDGAWPLIGQALSTERLTLAAQAVGLSGRVLELSQRYAAEREQFGVPLVDIQAVAHMLASMAVDHDAARAFLYQAAWQAERGTATARVLSGVKLFATEAAMRIAHAGVQVHGGYGYAVEYEVERHFRDAKLLEIVGGTSQIQRNMIAQALGSTPGAFTRDLRRRAGSPA